MTLPLEFDIRAEKELAEACEFYETRRPGYGKRLALEVASALEAIQRNPKAARKVSKDIRRHVISEFPFCIYYRIDPQSIFIVSVFHTSRDPKTWQSRA